MPSIDAFYSFCRTEKEACPRQIDQVHLPAVLPGAGGLFSDDDNKQDAVPIGEDKPMLRLFAGSRPTIQRPLTPNGRAVTHCRPIVVLNAGRSMTVSRKHGGRDVQLMFASLTAWKCSLCI